jgi:hypothetical protein
VVPSGSPLVLPEGDDVICPFRECNYIPQRGLTFPEGYNQRGTTNLGALCSVGPTPIHPELGCEKAEGTEELLGSPFGISVLVPGLNK